MNGIVTPARGISIVAFTGCIIHLVVHVRFAELFMWGAGGTVVVHVSLTTMTRVRFRLRAII